MNFPMRLLRRGARLAALAGALLLASCGGGQQISAFAPVRVVVFGDEDSVITSDGRKYTVNALSTDTATPGAVSCATNPIWVQRLAADYGLVFSQCNPNNVENPTNLIYAAPGAKVADVTDQITEHLSLDTFSPSDLVTVLAGRNDILDLYKQYPATPAAELLQAAQDAGLALGQQVVRIVGVGGKVLISSPPDLSYSPYAIKENEDTGDSSRSALIASLTASFTKGLRDGIKDLTGDQIALIFADALVKDMAVAPFRYGSMTNVTTAVCDPDKAATVLDCTTDTLVTDGTAFLWLWADDTHLSPNGHAYLGAAATGRVRNNPL